MTNVGSAYDYFLKLRLYWHVQAWDSNGNLGGTLVAWRSLMVDIKAYITVSRIMVEVHVLSYSNVLRILNIYGPYCKRQEYWDNIFMSSLLDD